MREGWSGGGGGVWGGGKGGKGGRREGEGEEMRLDGAFATPSLGLHSWRETTGGLLCLFWPHTHQTSRPQYRAEHEGTNIDLTTFNLP